MNERARPLMVLGTASHVGKSLITAALCRIANDRGLRVAPFKAQNMSLEAAVTPDGFEIGRAQALQAQFARLAPHVDMNPILIKPTGDRHAQVIVDGVVWGDTDAWDYHRRRTHELFPRVVAAYERLAARFDAIVLEGAGSPAEINLRAGDIVNMRMAHAADAPCLLVVDIDRGGAFAALVGTLALLEPADRARIAGFVINKFRGDVALLEPGIATIVERTGVPCVGVIPWYADLGLEEEDGYDSARDERPWPEESNDVHRALRVAVIRAPFAANLSDRDALRAEPSVTVRDATRPATIADADLVLLPGSKSTLADLRWMRERGIGDAIAAHGRRGGLILGVCGGLQILGDRIADPHGVEGGGAAEGLGLLALATELASHKTVRCVSGRVVANIFGDAQTHGMTFSGYEIHNGMSRGPAPPFAVLTSAGGAANDDGAIGHDRAIVGSYVHGLLDDDAFRARFIDAARTRCGLAPSARFAPYDAERETRIARWSAHVATHLDLDAIERIAQWRATIAS